MAVRASYTDVVSAVERNGGVVSVKNVHQFKRLTDCPLRPVDIITGMREARNRGFLKLKTDGEITRIRRTSKRI